MNEVVCLYKPVGLTPLQLINKLRESDSKYQDIKIGFAGRLDPLAHGVMLLTVGEANKVRDKYLGLSKKYQFSVLFGVETDSYDYLGVLKSFEIRIVPINLEERIRKFVDMHIGTFSQTYPPFSSKPVNGIPLYKLAKLGKIDYQDLPTREVEVFSFNLLSIETVNTTHIKTIMLSKLKKIRGYFRQGRIIKLWQDFFDLDPDDKLTMAHFEIECGSGTYVRSLAQKMGEEFGCGAIAFEIYRTQVGNYRVEDSINLPGI